MLSGGEKKKVAIGSVLTMNPEVLLFDELMLKVNLIHEHMHYNGPSIHKHRHSHYFFHKH